jgi:pyruvate formate lyase activating enzyme
MRLLGVTETSLVDWDGCVSSVLFFGGCNLRCPFCYNSELARDDPGLEEIAWPDVAAMLKRKRRFLDGVVLLGGEPMLHPEVFDLCRTIKDIGLKVKVDTNGCFPYPLQRLIELELCDFVAMDVKAPLDDTYRKAAGVDVDLAVIRRSIRLLMESGIDYEFRTTLVPGLVDADNVARIGEAVKDARRLTLQCYIPDGAASPALRKRGTYTRKEAEAMVQTLRESVKEVRLRGKFL